jgi:hypothetical protein
MLQFPFKKQTNRSGAFLVDDVVSANTPIPTETLGIHVAKRFKRKLLWLPDSERLVTNALLDSPYSKRLPDEARARLAGNLVSRCHPLIDAVGTAFSQHRPLVLSPDSIWLAIEQGFAHHVAENAEALRHRLVRHEGSRKLVATISELSLPTFELAIADLSKPQ